MDFREKSRIPTGVPFGGGGAGSALAPTWQFLSIIVFAFIASLVLTFRLKYLISGILNTMQLFLIILNKQIYYNKHTIILNKSIKEVFLRKKFYNVILTFAF